MQSFRAVKDKGSGQIITHSTTWKPIPGIGVFLLINQWTNKRVAKVADEKLSSDRDIVGVILEYIQGIAESRNYNIIAQNQSRVQKAIDRKKKADIRAEIAAIPAVGVQNFTVKFIGVVIAGASILFYLNGSMKLVYTIVMLLCSFRPLILEKCAQVPIVLGFICGSVKSVISTRTILSSHNGFELWPLEFFCFFIFFVVS